MAKVLVFVTDGTEEMEAGVNGCYIDGLVITIDVLRRAGVESPMTDL
jgi:hypothetical protein